MSNELSAIVLNHVDVQARRNLNTILGEHIPRELTIGGIGGLLLEDDLARYVDDRQRIVCREVEEVKVVTCWVVTLVVQTCDFVRVRRDSDELVRLRRTCHRW